MYYNNGLAASKIMWRYILIFQLPFKLYLLRFLCLTWVLKHGLYLVLWTHYFVNAYNSLYFHPWVIASALKSDPKLFLHNKFILGSYREKNCFKEPKCNFLFSSSTISIINKYLWVLMGQCKSFLQAVAFTAILWPGCWGTNSLKLNQWWL